MDFARLIPELHVSDVARSLGFYRDVLRFDLLFSRELPGCAWERG